MKLPPTITDLTVNGRFEGKSVSFPPLAYKPPRYKFKLSATCQQPNSLKLSLSLFPSISQHGMAVLHSSLAPYCLKKLIILPFPYPKPTISTKRLNLFQAMSSSSKSQTSAPVYKVPGLDPEEMDRVAYQTFQRYSSSSVKRNGKGVAVVWFRNDLRVLDNEALYKAWISSQEVLAVYCVDPRLFGSTHYFGFPKTGGTNFILLQEFQIFDLPSWSFWTFGLFSITLGCEMFGILFSIWLVLLCLKSPCNIEWCRIEMSYNFVVWQRWERNFSLSAWLTWRKI